MTVDEGAELYAARQLAELAEHADHLNARIVALDEELQKYRALAANVIRWNDVRLDPTHGYGDRIGDLIADTAIALLSSHDGAVK